MKEVAPGVPVNFSFYSPSVKVQVMFPAEHMPGANGRYVGNGVTIEFVPEDGAAVERVREYVWHWEHHNAFTAVRKINHLRRGVCPDGRAGDAGAGARRGQAGRREGRRGDGAGRAAAPAGQGRLQDPGPVAGHGREAGEGRRRVPRERAERAPLPARGQPQRPLPGGAGPDRARPRQGPRGAGLGARREGAEARGPGPARPWRAAGPHDRPERQPLAPAPDDALAHGPGRLLPGADRDLRRHAEARARGRREARRGGRAAHPARQALPHDQDARCRDEDARPGPRQRPARRRVHLREPRLHPRHHGGAGQDHRRRGEGGIGPRRGPRGGG